jgi:hypothetical protein
MPVYVKIESKEEAAVKKEVSEAAALGIKAQKDTSKLSSLRKSKISEMDALAAVFQEMQKELEKIKQALPSTELNPQAPVAAKPSAVPAKQIKPVKKKKGYASELEDIRETIANLS